MEKRKLLKLSAAGDTTLMEWTPGVESEEAAVKAAVEELTKGGNAVYEIENEQPARKFTQVGERDLLAVSPVVGG